MKARLLWKFTGSLVGLLAILAILIAVNIIVSHVRLRADLTEEKLYTLSDGTRAVLQSLGRPVSLKFFFSGSSTEIPIPLKNFARQVEDLLKEYELASGGKLLVETYNPKPDSDAEEWAQRYGLAGEQLGLEDGALYLGLVAVQGDNHEVIPFLDPRNEEMLEYNITRMIARVANPKKPVLGILSSLPVMGVRSFPYAMPGQPRPKSSPPWVAFKDLSKDYDVRQLAVDTEVIDPAIDVMIVVHPKNVPEKTLFAIDQFILRGGRLLAFVDPLCVSDAMNQDPSMGGMDRPMSDLGPLTAAWGITYEPDQVVADLLASTRVQSGNNQIENNPVFLSLRNVNIDGKDIVTSSLESLGLPVAGAFSGAGVEGLSVGTLLVTSEQSALVNTMVAQMGAESVRRGFKSGEKRLNLAIRVQGKFKTAFPQGKPKPAPETGKKKADAKEPANSDDNTPALKESVKPSSVILVADVDLLYDAFAVQEIPIFGQRMYQPLNDNISFFANAVDQLSGSADMAKIRARGRVDRPFDRVQKLQSEAQQRWMAQERMLQDQLASTQERLENLQAKKDKSQRFILSAEQEQEIAKFKQEQIKTQHELKQVRKNLREGIEVLGVKVKVINILAIPLLVCLAGLAFGWQRRHSVRR